MTVLIDTNCSFARIYHNSQLCVFISYNSCHYGYRRIKSKLHYPTIPHNLPLKPIYKRWPLVAIHFALSQSTFHSTFHSGIKSSIEQRLKMCCIRWAVDRKKIRTRTRNVEWKQKWDSRCWINAFYFSHWGFCKFFCIITNWWNCDTVVHAVYKSRQKYVSDDAWASLLMYATSFSGSINPHWWDAHATHFGIKLPWC